MTQGYGYMPPRSFRKRRPVLFCLLLLLAVAALVWAALAVTSLADRKGFFSGPRLGLVRIEGFIGDADKVVKWTEELRRDATVAGVLVRIDSPGGAVVPSQEMHAAIRRLAKEKPVVVSMGTAAASGGYYIAVAGRELFASPSTLTGSIGVRMQLADVRGLMERLGVKSESLATGKFKTTGSPFRPLTDEEKHYLNALLDDMQDAFVRTVAEGRKLPLDTVRPLADGRVFTGRQALEAKLVDRLGDQEAALNRLTVLCNLPERPAKILEGPPSASPWWKKLLTGLIDPDDIRSLAEPRYLFYY